MASSRQQQQRTTSIVDISEIEDDETPAAAPRQQQQQQHEQSQQQKSASNSRLQPSATAASQLYLYHEDVHPQQRVSSLLSSMKNNLSAPSTRPQGGAFSKSADTSPSQTLARTPPGGQQQQQQQLAAIDYPGADGRLSPATRSLAAAGDLERSSQFARGARDADTPTATLQRGDAESAAAAPPPPAAQQKANLGTLTGVYFPCVQNIFGVILFIRMVWIVGTAGVPAAFALVFICCCVTFTTSISLSAIATNGIVPAGGSYFMISRSLGPECGGAVGTLFFLGTTVAGAMYITGAVEIMLNYMAPSWGLFGDFQRDVNILYNNIRVYGTLLLIIVGLMVWIGVRFVSKLAPIALFCVLFSIFSIYAGIFINYNGRPDLFICVVGDRLVTLKNLPYDLDQVAAASQIDLMSPLNSSATRSAEEIKRLEMRRARTLCTYERLRFVFCPDSTTTAAARQRGGGGGGQQTNNKAAGGSSTEGSGGDAGGADSPLMLQLPGYSGNANQAESAQAALDEKQLMRDLFKRPPNMSNCDPYFKQNRERIHLERAIPGIASGILFKNLAPRFREKGNIVSYDDGRKSPAETQGNFNFILVDITTTFTILISIYFPSCTGILAGSNRSGDLADAQKSIPLGTIAAQLTTSFVYLSSIVLFGSTFNNLFIRDKFGESMGGQLAVTQIAWPEPYIILVGGLLSTLGASLQSLVGAPRILQGIAQDDVIPCFHRFAKVSARGEPETAVFFTLAIAELAVLIGNLDFIAPILTISLVMCYFFINLACALHSLLGSPNWRPRFKFYHWSFSMLGCLLCLFVMVVSSWLYFVVAILLAGCIYRHIQYCGANKEWGDGKQGLALSAATYNLLKLTNEPHTKNWRPQLLLLAKLKPRVELEPPFSKANIQMRAQTTTTITTTTSAVATATADAAAAAGGANQLIKQTKQQTGSSSAPAAVAAAAGHLIELQSLVSEQQLQQQQQQMFADQLVMAHPKLLTFASQLKAGKGLTLVSSIIEGDYKQAGPAAAQARFALQEEIQREAVKGFAEVVVSSSIQEGLCHQIQTAGLGGLKHNTVILGWPEHWRKPAVPTKPLNLAGSAVGGGGAGAGVTTAQQSGIPQPLGGGGAEPKRGSLRLNMSAASRRAQHAHSQNKTRAHLFIDLMRNVQVSQNALLVVKGVDSWPESCDRLGGTIDVWWIVNEGGLLMLLPHLLRQHRTWRACKLRIFTIAQASDNSDQMHDDLTKFLYHLRIDAKVDIVVMTETEISDYAYERTLMMEQRGEIIKRLNGQRKQSILLEQEVDGGRLIRFRIRKPSIYDFEETVPFIGAASVGLGGSEDGETTGVGGESQAAAATGSQAQSPSGSANLIGEQQLPVPSPPHLPNLRPDEANVRRMHTALSLNELILRRSKAAKLVILNLPGAPKESTPEAENNYMEFIEVLTDKLERVLLVQNGGREVITIHS